MSRSPRVLGRWDRRKSRFTKTSKTEIVWNCVALLSADFRNTYNFLLESTYHGNKIPLGVVIMDFPGTSFIYNIIVQNYL